MAPGASVSSVARRYGIAPRVLFRWKQGLVPSEPEPVFLPVTVSDDPVTADGSPAMPTLSVPAAGAAVIVERPRDDVEVELVGGRRLRFARDTDPVTVRAMIDMLEGVAR